MHQQKKFTSALITPKKPAASVSLQTAACDEGRHQSLDPHRPEGIEFEPHYKVNHIARMWGFSRETIRKLFKDEPGVLRLGRAESRFRRGYESLSIPESVMRSVHHRLRQRTGRSA